MSEAENLEPGAARCPGLTVQDLLAKDSRAVPAYLTSHAYEYLGDAEIPYERYTSREFHEREIERMWPRGAGVVAVATMMLQTRVCDVNEEFNGWSPIQVAVTQCRWDAYVF